MAYIELYRSIRSCMCRSQMGSIHCLDLDIKGFVLVSITSWWDRTISPIPRFTNCTFRQLAKFTIGEITETPACLFFSS